MVIKFAQQCASDKPARVKVGVDEAFIGYFEAVEYPGAGRW